MKVKMIQDLRKRMGSQMKKIHEIFNKKPEVLQNKQMKNAIIEMKNTLEGINIRINEAEK